MEIEENKEISRRIIRKLIVPMTEPNLKPGENSKKICLERCQFTFKSFLVGKQTFCYRCIDRVHCKAIIQIPFRKNFDQETLELIDSNNVQEIKIISDHSETCFQLLKEQEKDDQGPIMIDQVKSDIKVLERFIRKNPLLEPKIIKAEMLKQNQAFKNLQIIKTLQEIRNEIFPRDEEKVFTTFYCTALDSDEHGLNLFRGHIKIPNLTNKNVTTKGPQEAIILTNKPMLKQLSYSSQWHLDATFKIAPKGFLQILNMIVYIPNLQIFFPVAHVIMTHKTKDLYSHVFQHLRLTAELNGFSLNPTLAMCDFEQALRGGIQNVFPQVKLGGCYFHFVKALYEKVKKLGLTSKLYKNKAKILISYLQIISHCPKENRKKFFQEINTIFAKENTKFSQFLNYFKKNWLLSDFMDNLFEVIEKGEDIEFIRTNNPCEVFHHFLSKFIIDSTLLC